MAFEILPYLFQALAENQNTPVPILRNLSVQPVQVEPQALERALAGNLFVARDILETDLGRGGC